MTCRYKFLQELRRRQSLSSWTELCATIVNECLLLLLGLDLLTPFMSCLLKKCDNYKQASTEISTCSFRVTVAQL